MLVLLLGYALIVTPNFNPRLRDYSILGFGFTSLVPQSLDLIQVSKMSRLVYFVGTMIQLNKLFKNQWIQISYVNKFLYFLICIFLLFSSSWHLWFNLSFDPSYSTWIERGCKPKRVWKCHPICFSCHSSSWFISLHLWNLYSCLIDYCSIHCHMSSK